jgi:hypothetical protein
MSKRAGKPQKKIEEQIKPILEKLTFGVLKNKPDNIVSINNIIFLNSPNLCLITWQNNIIMD